MSNTLNANGIKIRINTVKNEDYISLSDIAQKSNPDQPNFKPLEFEGFRKHAGLNAFVLYL